MFVTRQSLGRVTDRRAATVKSGNVMSETHMLFACPNCGQAGGMVWSGEGANRVFVRVTGGFHTESRFAGVPHTIVCNVCDEIDPGRTE